MTNQLDIHYEDGIVHVYNAGEDSYSESLEMLRKVAAFCRQHDCFNILGVQDMTPLDPKDAYDHQKIFEKVGITSKYRIAWVEKDPETRQMLELAAAAIRHGIKVDTRIFADVSEAKAWLLKKS